MPNSANSLSTSTSAWTQTADLSDEYGDQLQVCQTAFHQYGGRLRVDGIIRTVLCYEDSVLLKRVIEQDGRGHILVVDGGGSLQRAIFGEKTARRAIASGWEGIIIYGATRDSAALAELPFAVKALGTTPLRALQTSKGALDVSVTFGGVTFRPGAHLWSDHDGIVAEASPDDR